MSRTASKARQRGLPAFVWEDSVLGGSLTLLRDGAACTANEVAEALGCDLLAARTCLSRATAWGWLASEGDNGNESTGPLRTYRLNLDEAALAGLLRKRG